tara:strand:+ start:333 stop:482 length:150 start_codon:yes stop_codon:yes gene_type:complete
VSLVDIIINGEDTVVNIVQVVNIKTKMLHLVVKIVQLVKLQKAVVKQVV